MAKRANAQPQSLGLLIDTHTDAIVLPEIDEHTDILYVQEFETSGKSYTDILEERRTKINIDDDDVLEIEKITDFIVDLHTIKHPSKDETLLSAVYKDGLRSELVHPELTLSLLNNFDESHTFLPPSKHTEYIGDMWNLIHKWRNRSDRLSALHGDFWSANVFFRNDKSLWVIDYSRAPWGDPGIDIGRWMTHYILLYHETKNSYFRELGEKFITRYSEKSDDKDIREFMALGVGLWGVIYTIPEYYPGAKGSFFQNIVAILKAGKLMWVEPR